MQTATVVQFSKIPPPVHHAFRAPPLREVVRKNNAQSGMQCSNCNLREICLPAGIAPGSAVLDELVYTRKRIKRGETLYRSGDEFRSQLPPAEPLSPV